MMDVFEKKKPDALIEERDQLVQNKDEFESLIIKTKALKEKTLSMLFSARTEIADLEKLAPTYPDSKKIPQRLQDLDKIIAEGVEALISIDENLKTYSQQVQAIEHCLQQDDTSTQSSVNP